jgi:GAF domain-containing protein
MELLQSKRRPRPVPGLLPQRRTVSVADLTDAEARWPRFVAALAQRGTYGSVHALPLRLRGEPLGTLNLFHRPNKTLHPGQAPTAHNDPS